MKPVSELYGRHPGADIYVVGSGTSMRVLPPSFLEGRITIGLNMAWRIATVQYAVTIGPHVNVPEFIAGETPRPEITWITKREKARQVLTPEQFEHADRHFYTFSVAGKGPRPVDADLGVNDGARVLDFVRRPAGDMLYQWSSISQTAANLAANMGARNVILVGCDNCSLGGNHHAHSQHTKWMGKEPDERYLQYYEGLAEIRAALRERGVNLVSLSPFLKLDDPGMDFARLCGELGEPPVVEPTGDISASDRHRPLPRVRPPAPPPHRAALNRARSLAKRAVSRAFPRADA